MSYFTSESVTEGHPDKVADRISDAVLDAVLAQDPCARVACETFMSEKLCVIGGEITANAEVKLAEIARAAIRNIGYTSDAEGFDLEGAEFLDAVRPQCREIGCQVEDGGAGDQGMMFGYACGETPEMMPLPISLAHRLAAGLAEARRTGILPYLRPDGKTQVTVEYDANGRPVRVAKVLVSAHHSPEVDLETLRRDVLSAVVRPVVDIDDRTDVSVNSNGSFETGGPGADTGLTGRKIIVDTYGGYARHGGGAFSGKDPTKVDRSGAYMMRYVAKNIVAAGLASRCEAQVSYGIGGKREFAMNVDTFGTGRISDERLADLVREHFDLSPGAIIEKLDLRRPIYTPLSAYGHFGRDGYAWERTDKASILRQAAGRR